MDVNHTVTYKASFISPQNVIYKELMCSVSMSAICKIASTEEDLETDGCSLSAGVDAVDCHELLERVSVGIGQILVHELLCCSCCTAAIKASSLAGVYSPWAVYIHVSPRC